MFENEIEILTSKLGMTVGQMYDINLAYQHFVGITTIIDMTVSVIAFIICAYLLWNKHKIYFAKDEQMIALCFAGVIALVIALGVLTIMIGITYYGIGPLVIPEYYAMQTTIEQLSSMIP